MCRSGNIEGRVPGRVVEAAAHNYCEEYFVGELRNELDGFLSMQDIELTKRLLRGLRRHRFYFHELETKVARSKQYEDLPVRDVVARLYDAGVIGNVVAAAHEERVHFKYRNPHHDIDYDAQLVLHNALVNAFNTPRALAGQL